MNNILYIISINWIDTEVELEKEPIKWENVIDLYNDVEYVYSEYEGFYVAEDETIFTEDEGVVGEDCETIFTKDTNEYYVDDSELFYTEDSEEWFANNDNLYQDYDTDEWYESDEYIITCESNGETYYDYYGDNFTRVDNWPNGVGYYFANDCYYCEHCDESHHEDYECPYDSTGLDWYWTWTSEHILNSEKSEFRFWIEIEKNDCVSESGIDQLKEKGWRCEEDSSVCWWEYISPILPFNNEGIEWLLKTWHDMINDYGTNGDCGGHIHISQKNKQASELYGEVEHYRQILWWIYPGRAGASYCNKDTENPDSKYRDVRIHPKYNTVEFRIFPGVENDNQIKFRLALLTFFITNKTTTKQGALDILNKKQSEFIDILNIVYKDLAKKMEVVQRIYKFYEINEKDYKAICTKAYKICDELNK